MRRSAKSRRIACGLRFPAAAVCRAIDRRQDLRHRRVAAGGFPPTATTGLDMPKLADDSRKARSQVSDIVLVDCERAYERRSVTNDEG